MKGGDAYLLSESGYRIRKCYLQSKIRYDAFVQKKRPIGAPMGDYQKWNDWCARRYGELLANRDTAIEQALAAKRRTKCLRRKQQRQWRSPLKS